MLINFFKKLFLLPSVEKHEINVFFKAAEHLRHHVTFPSIDLGDYIDNQEKQKAEDLKNIGFDNATDVIEIHEQISKIKKIENIKNVVKYFMTFYPQSQFLLYNQVKDICNNYDFTCSELKNYIGEIPDINYSDIKNFSIREQDKTYYGLYKHESNSFGIDSAQHIFKKGFEISSPEIYKTFKSNDKNNILYNKKIYFNGFPLIICSQISKLKIPDDVSTSIVDINNSNNYFNKYNFTHNFWEEVSNTLLPNKKKKKLPYSIILQPVLKFDVYGFLIVTIIQDEQY